MKKTLTSLSKMLLLALCICVTAPAQDDANAPTDTAPTKSEGKDTDKKDNKVEMGAVATALSKLKTFNSKPNLKAKYYVYLQSASWCGPCRAEMPDIVREYDQMRLAGVEIILLGCDRTESEAMAYLGQFHAGFPGLMVDKGSSLPGFIQARGIPNAIFVDADGKMLTRGHGSIIMKWREIIGK